MLVDPHELSGCLQVCCLIHAYRLSGVEGENGAVPAQVRAGPHTGCDISQLLQGRHACAEQLV